MLDSQLWFQYAAIAVDIPNEIGLPSPPNSVLFPLLVPISTGAVCRTLV